MSSPYPYGVVDDLYLTYKSSSNQARDKHVVRPEDWQLNDIEWRPDKSQGFFKNDDYQYIVDSTTGKKYLNESRMLVRLKRLYPGLLFIPILSVVAGISNIAYRSIKIFSGHHFWGSLEEEQPYEFTEEIQKDNEKI